MGIVSIKASGEEKKAKAGLRVEISWADKNAVDGISMPSSTLTSSATLPLRVLAGERRGTMYTWKCKGASASCHDVSGI